MINYTIPGRLHIIVSKHIIANKWQVYITFRRKNKRKYYHYHKICGEGRIKEMPCDYSDKLSSGW